jgi:hypothetical protein
VVASNDRRRAPEGGKADLGVEHHGQTGDLLNAQLIRANWKIPYRNRHFFSLIRAARLAAHHSTTPRPNGHWI